MRVLCTCLPGYGHFHPMVALARALVGAGHDVVFSTAPDFCPKVEEAGFAALPSGISLAEQMAEGARRYPDADRLHGAERFEQFVPRMLGGVAAPARAADLVPLVAEVRPDLVLHDETELAGPVAAAVADVPYADQSVGILRPLAMARLAGATLAPLWADWGVGPGDLGDYGGLFRYLYLDVCPPRLQSPEIAGVAVAHPMRNVELDAAPDEAPPWLRRLPDRPTVYVSLGTIFNRDPGVFAAILGGLGGEAMNVVVTVGADNDPADLGPQPDNVRVERYIPQAVLLPHCDVVVNQGGTALLPILAEGLPVLVVPQGANQFHNAAACLAAGVGGRLLPGEVTPGAVRREVRVLLDEPGHRRNARRLQAEIASMPGPEEGVRLLEQLHHEARPLARSAG